MTEVGEEDNLEAAASPDQKANAVGTLATSNTPGVLLRLGEEAQGGPGLRGVARAGAKDWAPMPGVPWGPAQGELAPEACGDSPGRPQPHRREGQPAAQGGEATAPPRGGTKPDRGGDMAGPPLVGAPPGQEGDYGAGGATGGKGEEWGHSGGQQAISGERPPAGRRGTSEPPNPRRERSKPGRQGGERSREQRVGRAEGPTARPTWGWILLALGLWGVLQVGTALVLKESRKRGEVFAFDALHCGHSHALGCHSGRRVCREGRVQGDNGRTSAVPAGERRILQLERGIRFRATLCKQKRSAMRVVCGASWHSKRGELLDIREPTRLSITKCGEVSTPWVPPGEEEQRVRMPKGPYRRL